MYRVIDRCRICGNENLVPVCDLGMQSLTGIFPRNASEPVPVGPLRLVKCHGDRVCHLLQLQHSCSPDTMFGDNYGYRSGLNELMVRHLKNKVQSLLSQYSPSNGSLIIDIGSNDGTTLNNYPAGKYHLLGVDPTGGKFVNYYNPEIDLIEDFFDASIIREYTTKKAAIVTSFSMFYDLEDPVSFARQIRGILSNDGIWCFEQSYMPLMIERCLFDTICHEHLEYYGLYQIQWILERADMRIIDVDFNDINGGSFSVVSAPKSAKYTSNINKINSILCSEHVFFDLERFYEFDKNIICIREKLIEKIENVSYMGESVYGLGASTKGNVILQYCDLDVEKIPLIGEVNSYKFNRYTPGTKIPIVSETELLEVYKPKFLLVLPWHFKEFFINRELLKPINLIYPFEVLEND